jgi:hypothetical protein
MEYSPLEKLIVPQWVRKVLVLHVIYGLFNDVKCSSDYATSNNRMIKKRTDHKEVQ